MSRRAVFSCNLFNVGPAYVLRRFFTMMIPSHLIEPFASLPQGDLLLSDDALQLQRTVYFAYLRFIPGASLSINVYFYDVVRCDTS